MKKIQGILGALAIIFLVQPVFAQSWILDSGGTINVYDCWADMSGDFYLAGESGKILKFDGASMTTLDTGFPNTLYGVLALSSSDIFTVGAGGLLLHYDGSIWTSIETGTTEDLYDIWGAHGNIFIVGNLGTILYYNDQVEPPIIGPMNTGVTADLRSIWGEYGTKNIFASGKQGTILSFDGGSSWNPVGGGITTEDLNRIWGSNSNDIFIVGNNGTILHSIDIGVTWVPMVSNTPANLLNIWGIGPSGDIFAVGGGGTIIHYIDESWSAMESPVTQDLTCVSGVDLGEGAWQPPDAFSGIIAAGSGNFLVYQHTPSNTWRATEDAQASSAYGLKTSRSSSMFNNLAILIIPSGVVFFLKVMRRKR